jgi:hypothetical protein
MKRIIIPRRLRRALASSFPLSFSLVGIIRTLGWKTHFRKDGKMAVNELRTPIRIVFIILLCFLWISCPGEVYGKTLYEYVDKDGTAVITDIQPPGGKFKTIEVPTEKTEEKKIESGNRPNKQAGETAGKSNEKREKIRDLKEELKKAKIDEQHYRSNMNQATGFSQRHQWRVQVDKQLELIEKIEKEIEELERRP